jgi:hypothetical protein
MEGKVVKMQVIHKLQINLECKSQWSVPIGTKVRYFAEQDDAFFVWVEKPLGVTQTILLEFEIFGTGWEFEAENRIYVGTIQHRTFVWHLFYKENP